MWAYAAISGELHLRKAGQTAQLHAPSCRHSEARDLASAYGAAPGAISEVHGQPMIDLGRLFHSARDESEGDGGGKRAVPSRAPGMLSLGWLLMAQAGLTVWHRGLKHRNPWRDLYFASREMRVKVGKTIIGLDQMLLLSKESDPRQTAFNYAKLRKAEKNDRHVIVMAKLPSNQLALGHSDSLSLGDSLGATITLFPEKLNAGLAKFSQGASRWRRELKPVLLVGLAKPKLYPSSTQANGQVMASVGHFALINVSDDLVPVPSPKHERDLAWCPSTNDVYVTGPRDDGTLRLWAPRVGRNSSMTA